MIAKHIQERRHKHRDAEQLWTLRESGSDQNSRVASSEDAKLFRRRVATRDQPFRRSKEIIERILAISSLASLVPLDAELSATSSVDESEDAAALNHVGSEDAKLR